MPDFFVPDVDFKPFTSGKREKSRAAIKAADVTAVIDSIKKILSPELVQKLGAVYEFTIKGKANELRKLNGSGSHPKNSSSETAGIPPNPWYTWYIPGRFVGSLPGICPALCPDVASRSLL